MEMRSVGVWALDFFSSCQVNRNALCFITNSQERREFFGTSSIYFQERP
jgi:hypothetical protein